ncbi:RNA-dependent DNA polymerase [Leptolyngbya sp. 'hensonii']|uniref:reverse transcriptase family protein n=1 Tax=Leptolyngbya sp. 'hensonii' TaxID=1922337 RepID=UPI00094F84DC|nr:reverse transcriptase family protein [Leptolyngbya sp. 'hensonii']OLP18435.1 RNA-dependent DNA polymerase [Leptolyngbya sp. 'hensonii']
MSEPSPPRTREELWDRIRQTSREEIILEEMIRLGFWPAQGELPQDPADEIRRRGEIHRELRELKREDRRLQDEKILRKQMLEKRLAESRRKQQETKERRERERQERSAAWEQRRQQEILYLGEGVSGGLNQTEGLSDRLQQHRLPLCLTAEQLATAMGLTIAALRFLAFARRTSPTSHYVRFQIPKKTGGLRLISAPMPRLKQVQYWILDNILDRLTPHDAAHGFCRGRSIVTNALPHLGADVVINLDLQDFFPTISYRRVKGLFRSFGYSEAVATILALLCTEPEVETVDLDGQTYYVALTDRRLPQGAPTSPTIANLICRRLDRRLTEMATTLGFTYTRYADDLTFSGSGDALRQICNLLQRSVAILTHEGFTVHDQKTRVLRNSRQQEVTGIVVNHKLNVDRETLKRFRAILYQIEKDGPAGKQWGHSRDLMASIHGFANYVAMVNPEKGQKLLAQVKRIKQKYKRKRR